MRATAHMRASLLLLLLHVLLGVAALRTAAAFSATASATTSATTSAVFAEHEITAGSQWRWQLRNHERL